MLISPGAAGGCNQIIEDWQRPRAFSFLRSASEQKLWCQPFQKAKLLCKTQRIH